MRLQLLVLHKWPLGFKPDDELAASATHQLHCVWALLVLLCTAEHHQVLVIVQLIICCCSVQAGDLVKVSHVIVTLWVRTAAAAAAAAAAAEWSD
jgi:hypothetical protein